MLIERIVGWGDGSADAGWNTPWPVTDPPVEAINLHAFQASLGDWATGSAYVDRAAIVADYELTPDDEADLDWLKAKYDEAVDKKAFAMALDNVLLQGASCKIYRSKRAIIDRIVEACEASK